MTTTTPATTLTYRFQHGGKSYAMPFHTMTVDEWIEAERATGRPWVTLCAMADVRTAQAIKALFWLCLRREQPNLTYEALNFSLSGFVFEIDYHGATDDDAPAEDEPTDGTPAENPTEAAPVNS